MLEQQNISTNTWITTEDVVRERRISSPSARVYLARQARAGNVVRLKNNLYVSGQVWEGASWQNILKMANRIQVPSYISLLTALAYYEVSTQIPAQRIESIARTRTYSKIIRGIEFSYKKINSLYFGGFIKTNGLFIATPEKALADAIYLSSFGKYALDIAAMDMKSIDTDLFNKAMEAFPDKTRRWGRKNGLI